MEKIKHLTEAALLSILFAAFKALPIDVASAVGGFMARSVGPFLSAHKTAQKNLAMAFPEKSDRERHKIVMDMWDNLGRVGAELPFIPDDRLFKRMQIHGLENQPRAGQAALFFGGHIGNWEMSYPIAFRQGLPLTLIYRQANNPYVDQMIAKLRATQSTDMLPKGFKGAVKLARTIKSGHSLAMLIDQKMNDGIAVPFFGRDAMTAPAIAEFGLRYDLPLIPARVIRTKGCYFEATVYPPLAYEKTGDEEKDALAIMTQINQMLESWIREYPAQWFWVHKRWPNPA